MNVQFNMSLVFLLVFLILILVTQQLYRAFKLPPEQSRKFLHVTGGMLALLFPLYLHSHWFVLILCALATILLTITYINKLLPSVHGTKRFSIGSIIFPLPVYICFFTAEKMDHNMLLFYLPVSLLTIADTIAELGGRQWGHLSLSLFNERKTVVGSLCFAAAALILSLIFVVLVFKLQNPRSALIIITVTIGSTLAESISFRGLDNLSVPLSALILLLLFV
jgi:dolichol kinase